MHTHSTTRNESATSESIDRPNSILLLQWWIRQLLSNTNTIGTKRTPYITVNNTPYRASAVQWSTMTSFFIITTTYLSALRMSQQKHIAESLSSSSSIFPKSNVQMIVQYLQDAQLLLSASYDHITYQLWLPNVWGTMVLPKLLGLCKDVVLYIKRSSYYERLVASILERFPIHNHSQKPFFCDDQEHPRNRTWPQRKSLTPIFTYTSKIS